MATLQELEARLLDNRQRNASLSFFDFAGRARINTELAQLTNEIRQQGGNPDAIQRSFEQARLEASLREQQSRLQAEQQRMLAQGRAAATETRDFAAIGSEDIERQAGIRAAREALPRVIPNFATEAPEMGPVQHALDRYRAINERITSRRDVPVIGGAALEWAAQRVARQDLERLERQFERWGIHPSTLTAETTAASLVAERSGPTVAPPIIVAAPPAPPSLPTLSGPSSLAAVPPPPAAANIPAPILAAAPPPPPVADPAPSLPQFAAAPPPPPPPITVPTPALPQLAQMPPLPVVQAPPVLAQLAEAVPPPPPLPTPAPGLPQVAETPPPPRSTATIAQAARTAPQQTASEPPPIAPTLARTAPTPPPAPQPRSQPGIEQHVQRFGVMGRGNSGEGVRELQQFLSEQLGPQWRHNGSGIRDDGHFGPQTEAALQEFQRRNNLRPDGLLGRRTLEAVKAAPQNTLRAEATGLEQARQAAQAVTGGNLTVADASAVDGPGMTPRQRDHGPTSIAHG